MLARLYTTGDVKHVRFWSYEIIWDDIGRFWKLRLVIILQNLLQVFCLFVEI